MLGVDFLCDKIRTALSLEELLRMHKMSGEELLVGFRVYGAIKKLLRQSKGHV